MTSHPDQPARPGQPPARTSNGHESPCWVIYRTDPDADSFRQFGFPYDGDGIGAHYPSRSEAIAAVSDLGDIPVQLPQACYVHTCDSCHQDLADSDHGSVVHWLSAADATREAPFSDWTSDGRAWHCANCPPLASSEQTADLAWLPRDPGPGAQLLPGMGITRADIDVLGPAGVIPQQADTHAHDVLAFELGDDGDDGDEDGVA